MSILLRALLIVFVSATSSYATTYWEEDFENHLYPNWVGGGGCITAGSPDGVACGYPQITTSTSYNGTHSLWSHYPGGGVQSGTFMDRNFTETTDLWTRQYARWDNFTFGPENDKFFITGGPEAPVGVYWLHQAAGDELHPLVNHPSNVTCPNSSVDITCNYPPNQGHSIPLNDNTWHCIETHQNNGTANTANGLVELYIDGVLTTRYTGLLMKTTSSGYDLIRPYAQYGQGDRYQDDLAVGNARIGCAAPGGGGGGGGGPIIMFITQSIIATSALLQVLFIGRYFWEWRTVAVQAAVKFWRYAAEVPTPKEMYWSYRYKQAVKRWQKQAPLMLEHQPMMTLEVPKAQERLDQSWR